MNTTNMGRPRKLTTQAVQQAAVDRRNGMTWKALSLKYECAINTIRYSLAQYSDEFAPTVSMLRPQVEQQLNALQSDMDNIKTKTISGYQRTGVYGSVELKRHYHDGSGIVMEGTAYAYNGTDKDCTVSSFFRHSRMDAGGFQRQDPEFGPNNELPPPVPLAAGTSYSDTADSDYLRFPVPNNGGRIVGKDSYEFDAHIHLDVHGNVTDTWHNIGDGWKHTFTYKDDASYEGDE